METLLYLVLGQTGLEHMTVANSLESCSSSEGNKLNLKCYDMKAGFALAEGIENSEEINEYLTKDLPVLWEDLNTVEKTNRCHGAYHSIIDLIYREKPDIAVLFAHLLWYRNESFFITLHPQTVCDEKLPIKPAGVITLIDDIYHVRSRIRNRRTSGGPKLRVDFSLGELVVWRDLEILLSTMLTEQLFGQSRGFHYIWAVKHPIHSLWKLIAEPQDLVIYSAFPISSTRGCKDKMDDINLFRNVLHTHYVISDPLTIDEYPLLQSLEELWRSYILIKMKESNKNIPDNVAVRFDLYGGKCTVCENEYELVGNKVKFNHPIDYEGNLYNVPDEILLPLDDIVTLTPEKRWHLYPGEIFKDMKPCIDASQLSIDIPAWEVMNATKGINSQIRLRDFQLIERADAIVAYRPNYQQIKLSAGVTQEIEFALGLRTSYKMNLSTITIWPEEQDGSIPSRPGAFGGGAASNLHYASPVASVKDALQLLEDLKIRKEKHFAGWKTYEDLVNRKRDWVFRTST